MKTIQLKNFRGLPVYFKVQINKDGTRQINFANTEKSVVGDRLLMGESEYQIEDILEERISPFDYGIPEPVYFQSALASVIYLEPLK